MFEKSDFINISEVLKKKNPKLYAILPRFIIRYIEKVIHQNDLNRDLKIIENFSGVEKFQKFFDIHNIQLKIKGEENIPREGKYIFASNHPLGGPDGMLFIIAVMKFFPKAKFLVNDILMNLPDVKNIFLPINKHGINSREGIKRIEEAYLSDDQILIFPAGLVSRKIKGVISDLEWHKSFISHAKKYKRDVIPVYIDGKNSNFFYNLANFRKRIGLKANLEMFYLVDELYSHTNNTFTINFGAPVSYTLFDNSKSMQAWAEEMKQKTYALSKIK